MTEIEQWIDEKLKQCADREKHLLGNTKIKDWVTLLNYELGKRDLLWELQRFLQEQEQA